MQVTVNIPERIVDEAKATGVTVEEFVERMLAEPRPSRETAIERQARPEIQALLEAMASHSDRIPPLPERITREWIYQDHD